MSPAKFKEYINNPINLNKADEADLKELIQEFPYFNAAQVMLSKLYKNEENFRFERQLKLAAMYAGDRTKLFDYLNEQPVKDEAVTENIVTTDSPKIEIKQEEATPVQPEVEEPAEQEIPKQELIEEKPKEEKKKVEDTTKPLTRFTLAADEEVTEAEEEITEPINLNATVHIKPDITVEEEKAEETIEAKKEVEDISEEPEEKIVAEEVPEYNIEEVLEEQAQEEVVVEVDEDAPLIAAVQKVEEEEKSEEAVSFYDWLALKGKREEEAKIEEEKAQAEPEKKVDIDSIIGKFLNEQPTISRPKAEFYNPTDMAKRSVEDNNDIVTESLAKLYLKQHLYAKAITVYEKLCLLIPEKSETFASQIKKIKEEHNID